MIMPGALTSSSERSLRPGRAPPGRAIVTSKTPGACHMTCGPAPVDSGRRGLSQRLLQNGHGHGNHGGPVQLLKPERLVEP